MQHWWLIQQTAINGIHSIEMVHEIALCQHQKPSHIRYHSPCFTCFVRSFCHQCIRLVMTNHRWQTTRHQTTWRTQNRCNTFKCLKIETKRNKMEEFLRTMLAHLLRRFGWRKQNAPFMANDYNFICFHDGLLYSTLISFHLHCAKCVRWILCAHWCNAHTK